ncbi:uncharacterized protein LOC114254101 [Monomorium pharaonis]|uniref:uncharacterized protein LOC114254101 n=1 Tax=Monomorium pharaonis TaxID=307658 RepID=UPI00102E1BD8|nr:uncharacterized protein LOC114254101 [Monomorium pharaonis]
MHGVRSVKGKAKSAEQFRLECVYADASLFLPLFHSRLFVLPCRYSRSYYFSSVLVTIGTPETKESFERGKDKSREWLRGRNGGQKEEDIGRERRKTTGRHGWQEEKGSHIDSVCTFVTLSQDITSHVKGSFANMTIKQSQHDTTLLFDGV